jgi:hypothetical protein
VDDDPSGVDGLRTCAVDVLRRAETVVVDDGVTVVHVPDLDAELVNAAAAIQLTIDGGQEESTVPRLG